jgi:hypothetical protein
MAYETGTATGVNDLCDKLRLFLSSNGWTIDANSTESTGKRFHAHIGTVYANFRSFVAEIPSSNINQAASSACTSLAFNIGTGYSGATAWYAQAGTPISSAKNGTAGITNIAGAVTAYHFFAHNSGANVMVVVEYSTGLYQMLGFGTLTKFGTYTGGEYFFGSRSGVDNSTIGSGVIIPGVGFFSSLGANPNAYINATVDSEAGWKWSESLAGAPSSVRKSTGNESRFKRMQTIQPNSLNDLTVFLPVRGQVYRDTTNSSTASAKSPLGEVPKVFFCTINFIIPGQQVVLGGTNYRVFPFFKKDVTTTTVSTAGTGHSAYYGFAVAE